VGSRGYDESGKRPKFEALPNLFALLLQANALPWDVPPCSSHFTDGQVISLVIGMSSVALLAGCALFYVYYRWKSLAKQQRTDGYVDLGNSDKRRSG
jgi:hypothetical protein